MTNPVRPEPGQAASGRHGYVWPSGASVVVRRARGAVIVAFRGALGDCAAEVVGRVLRDLVDDQGNRKVVIDLQAATRVDPAVLDVFASVATSAHSRGGSVRLYGAPRPVAPVAGVTRYLVAHEGAGGDRRPDRVGSLPPDMGDKGGRRSPS